MSSHALRVLACAMHLDTTTLSESNLTFIGLAGMIDPARPEAIQSVEQFSSRIGKNSNDYGRS